MTREEMAFGIYCALIQNGTQIDKLIPTVNELTDLFIKEQQKWMRPPKDQSMDSENQ